MKFRSIEEEGGVTLARNDAGTTCLSSPVLLFNLRYV
jgi:hypothetical protein